VRLKEDQSSRDQLVPVDHDAIENRKTHA